MTTASIPVVDPNVHQEERARLSRQSQQILAAFMAAADGKVGSDKLTEIAQRFGARIHDLRRAGYVIDIVRRDRKSGETIYQLQPEEQGVQRKAEMGPVSEEVKGQRKAICAHIAKMEAEGATIAELSRAFPSIGAHALKQAIGAIWAYGLISDVAGEVRGGDHVWHITIRGRAMLGNPIGLCVDRVQA